LDTSGPHPSLFIVGADPRGVLFGVGYLLRKLELAKQKITLPDNFEVTSVPKMKLRGHQLGYRPKTNSYDGWDVPMWEQYIRDLAIFGCNAIELIPPRSDDDPDSPHFPLPQMEMMIEMSRLADEYGMNVWIWYPAMDRDYSDPKTIEFALKEWADVFRRLPRVDAVFVPGGDPGHTQPKYLFDLLEKQTANLHQFHPKAAMWVSPQSFTATWMDEFVDLMKREPEWLSGIVYGPQVRMPIADLRALIPARYPIRDYPDITHSRHCQYPVPNWDLAFAVTEGREPINPRPTQMAHIFRATALPNAIGFITYSEGCNDDVNKAIWSALGWDPNADVKEILGDYSRYFISGEKAQEFGDLLLGLEENWIGAVATNTSIQKNTEKAWALEHEASPPMKLNWRFQQALYRAFYDSYVSMRLRIETEQEARALNYLRLELSRSDSLSAIKKAEEILYEPINSEVIRDTRARLLELGEALFQSIRMQLSSTRYYGEPGRGTNLDQLDQPLNNSPWLRIRFGEIRRLLTEAERVTALNDIINWRHPGEGGFYDDLGDPRSQPHLVKGQGWEKDPGFFHTPQIGFTETKSNGQPLPASWWTSAETLYDEPLRMHYDGLDKNATYKLRIAYGRYRNNPIRLVANNDTEIHGYLNRPTERLEFALPKAATADGDLDLTWYPTKGLGGNGRLVDVAEVWLLKQP
ncbi:MAG TPA: hypothetical protein VGR78_05615, partial [Verrucomicrobiae bacterium]|nr:hypothetical protein [Verrucomicrobiae bacterium]